MYCGVGVDPLQKASYKFPAEAEFAAKANPSAALAKMIERINIVDPSIC